MAVSRQAELESILGHWFRDARLLDQALMHSSRVTERSPDDPQDDNEKLEFLGDAVLGLVVSEEMVRRFPDWTEGQLSKGRSRVVNSHSLFLAAEQLGLGEFLRLGKGEEKTGGRTKPALLADAYEAVVAAIYLDSGLDAARGFVQRSLVDSAFVAEAALGGRSDHKSSLQEFLQAQGATPGIYSVVAETGPDHQKTFLVELRISGEVVTSGSGRTKKEAEQSAALAALKKLGAPA